MSTTSAPGTSAGPGSPPSARTAGPAGRGPGKASSRHSGKGGGPARAEQPGQHRFGDGVGAGADEHALPGGPGRGGHGEQAGARPLGRVDPVHAERGQLAAQLPLPDGVGLIRPPRQDQRYGHACPPSGRRPP